MSSQRPFFANFLAAFRAHSAIQPVKAPSSSPSAQPSHTSNPAMTSSSAQHTASTPRTISSKTPAGPTATRQIHSPRTHSTSPLSRSPGQSSPGTYHQSEQRNRRGSDSSSDGFRDIMGADKWYIGGRTVTGEERFFKLGVVKRHRSIDRLSMDRLSL